ncbi:MAG: hypothetical protein VW270_14535, partial [Candidatus Poseidoniales archaeon]
ANILERPVPDLSGSITRIMGAVIAESETNWNKETKMVDVKITIFNYTTRARSYTILANYPERDGAEITENQTGGRKETIGLWAWKLDTLQPGEVTSITYSLLNLERGDWTDTDVFYRGTQEIIGASKMDEKILQDLKTREEQSTNESDDDLDQESKDGDEQQESNVEDGDIPDDDIPTPKSPPPTGQRTLFGGDE